MSKKICVYTCITGNYDELKNPTIIEDNIDYYCFTNNKNITSNIWKIIYIEDKKLSDAVLSRKIKILGHDEINGKYDIYVWMDSCLKITKPVNEFIDKFCDFSKHDYFVCKHHARKNIEEEMQACLFYGKETLENVNKLKEFYKKEKYKYENNLCENTIILRNYSETVQKTMKLWFDMLVKYSGRDQLTFNYAAHVVGLNFSLIDMVVWANEWFKAYNHTNKKSKISIYFKKNENDGISEYTDGDKIYVPNNIVGNKLNLNITIPKKCGFVDINVSPLCDYAIINTQINTKKRIEYSYINVYEYGDGIISWNNDSILRISSNFNKNDEIEIALDLDDNQMEYVNQYVNKLNDEKGKIINDYKDLQKEYQHICDSYNEIVNSKRWKIVNGTLKKFKK